MAICGMACRLPGGCDTPEDFWSLLCECRDVLGDRQLAGDTATHLGYYLDQETVRSFDTTQYNISPRQAESMDPQQRLLLQVTQEALERAGQRSVDSDTTVTGVYIGASTTDYRDISIATGKDGVGVHFSTGTALSMLAGNISFRFGFRGPSITMDSACASGMVAVHTGCQSLISGECDTVVTGGVNLILSPWKHIGHAKAGMLSSDGRCQSFDASANGYVRGEGCGVLVLKRLRDALQQDIPVLAVIKGSATNHAGRSVRCIMEPSIPMQEACIRRALARAGVQPHKINYVEAHGTGTSVGDPKEAEALHAVFQGRDTTNPLLLGSVKTNIGHLESCSGIASLIKVHASNSCIFYVSQTCRTFTSICTAYFAGVCMFDRRS